MIKQTVTFKDGTTIPVIAVCGKKELIQDAYRESFEIKIPTEETTYDGISTLATPENLIELIITEKDSETNEVKAQFTHRNFTLVTGVGMKTAPEDGTQYYFLSVAQKSSAEIAIERLSQENETILDAIVELAGIVAGDEVGEEE